MKRIIAFGLLLAVVITVAGCGETPKKKDPAAAPAGATGDDKAKP